VHDVRDQRTLVRPCHEVIHCHPLNRNGSGSHRHQGSLPMAKRHQAYKRHN
jgi:hypothetical protein